ncbi:DUF1883 domain-containing protein [Alkalicoccus chagannorensis]|uniref:DUF1883 domain-containing protein n=1 Tax=Alkalicoccus chagannorensis TaxID=427072 RepID=UPI0003FF157B|nr:DUF1883 domain-containing protein [Alkalicoccus chagannorensis]
MKSKYVRQYLTRGDTVSVELNRTAQVRLMDRNNFDRFKQNKECTFYGGMAKQSPAEIEVPRSGEWYIVITPRNKGDHVEFSVRFLAKMDY